MTPVQLEAQEAAAKAAAKEAEARAVREKADADLAAAEGSVTQLVALRDSANEKATIAATAAEAAADQAVAAEKALATLATAEADAKVAAAEARADEAEARAAYQRTSAHAAPILVPSDEQFDVPSVKAETSKPLALPSRVTRERRVALVIGNGDYAIFALQNPVPDAQSIARALRDVGFDSVRTIIDADRQTMILALQAFEDEATMADWAVVYFAGHGLEINGVNYLVPIDAALKADVHVQDEAVTLDRVLDAIEGAERISVAIIDACRDNPFQKTMRRSLATRSIGRGLSRVEPSGATLVAFAAKAGEVAEDGTGANSPFAAALVRRLREPQLEINKMFRLVRDDVLEATNNRQQPFTYGSLPGKEDFYFAEFNAEVVPLPSRD